MVVVVIAARAFDSGVYSRWIESETGILEIPTAAVYLLAAILGTLIFRRRRVLPAPWLGWWMIAGTLGCVYVAGEETSWGQHFFGWQTPESIRVLNDQAETNLHNMSSWFDQKPRFVLELGIFLAGIGYPLWTRARGPAAAAPTSWRYWFWPTGIVFPTALFVLFVKLPERVAKWSDLSLAPPMDFRASELQEFYIAWFLLLYFGSVWRRAMSRLMLKK